MGVKTVYHIEMFCQGRCHGRKIGGTTATQNEDIYAVLICQKLVCMVYGNSGVGMYGGRISTSKNAYSSASGEAAMAHSTPLPKFP